MLNTDYHSARTRLTHPEVLVHHEIAADQVKEAESTV